jgi:hypothetical protein
MIALSEIPAHGLATITFLPAAAVIEAQRPSRGARRRNGKGQSAAVRFRHGHAGAYPLADLCLSEDVAEDSSQDRLLRNNALSSYPSEARFHCAAINGDQVDSARNALPQKAFRSFE